MNKRDVVVEVGEVEVKDEDGKTKMVTVMQGQNRPSGQCGGAPEPTDDGPMEGDTGEEKPSTFPAPVRKSGTDGMDRPSKGNDPMD